MPEVTHVWLWRPAWYPRGARPGQLLPEVG